VLLWWITQTTNSASALAVAGMMALLPQALLGPLGGVLADRLNRRRVMIVADSVTAVCMVILITLFSTGTIQIWHAYLLMFVRSAMQAFQSPAASASTAMLVPKDWLGRAAGMNQTLQGMMTIAAAPLGALALAFLPIQGALMIDVVTAVLGIIPLFFYAIPQQHRARTDLGDGPTTLLADLHAGLRYVAGQPGILALFGVTALVVLTVLPTFSLTPLLVKQHFQGGVNEVAFMEALAGIGIIAGGVLITALPIFKRRSITMLVSFAVSCGTVALTALAPGNMLLLATFWWFISGVTYSTGNAPMMALLQSIVPNGFQGRVLSLLNTVMGLAGPIGLAIAGALAEAVGVRTTFIIGGTLSALICVAGLRLRPLREIESQGPSASGSALL
jgi:MFS transporter, DHA3 family, macrolide efflux protein